MVKNIIGNGTQFCGSLVDPMIQLLICHIYGTSYVLSERLDLVGQYGQFIDHAVLLANEIGE